MPDWSTIRDIPLIILGIILTWIWDILRCRQPRSIETFGAMWCQIHSQLYQECYRHDEYNTKTLPRPLPRKRKRALTNPQELEQWQRMDEQRSILLLSKIPLDVRLLIYEMVLKGSTSILHVIQKTYLTRGRYGNYPRYQSRLGCWLCPRGPHISHSNEYFPPRSHMPACTLPLHPYFDYLSVEKAPYGDFLSMSLTCRQIYSETIDTLYSMHVFSFAETRMLDVFASTILQQRLDSIRRIHLERALPYAELGGHRIGKSPRECFQREETAVQTFCTIVNSMKGLNQLHIDLFGLEKRQYKSAETEAEVFQPFLAIKPLQVFLIRVSWDRLGFDDQAAPFRILGPKKARPLIGAPGEDGIELDEYSNLEPEQLV